MDWHKTYNQALWSPTVLGLDDRAFRCWMLMRAYASQHETDGLVPFAAGMMFDAEGLADVCATELVERSLAGWLLTGWLDEQTSAAKVAAERRRVRAAVKKSRETKFVTPLLTSVETPLEVEVEVEEELEVRSLPAQASVSSLGVTSGDPLTCP